MSVELAKKLAADLRRTAAVCRIKREALEGAANYSRANSLPKFTCEPKVAVKLRAVWVFPQRHARPGRVRVTWTYRKQGIDQLRADADPRQECDNGEVLILPNPLQRRGRN